METATLRRISLNTGAILLGSICQKILGLVTLRQLAVGLERISPGLFGVWNVVFVIVGMFGVIADLNLDSLVIRELSRSGGNQRQILGTALLLKFLLASFAFLLTIICIQFLPYSRTVKQLVALASLSLPLSTIGLMRCVCAVELKAGIAQGYGILSSCVTLGCLLLLLSLTAPPGWYVAAQVFAGFPVECAFAYRASRLLKPDFKIDYSMLKLYARQLMPLGSAMLLGALCYRFDVIYLSLYRTEQEIGYYAAAYRITEAFSFMPGAILQTIMPLFTASLVTDTKRAKKIYSRTFMLLSFMAIAVILVIYMGSKNIVSWMYGSGFAKAVAPLRLLGIAEALMFITPLVMQTLLARKRNGLFFVCTLAATGVNIGGNMLLVNRFGISGCAVATILTEVTILLTASLALYVTESMDNREQQKTRSEYPEVDRSTLIS